MRHWEEDFGELSLVSDVVSQYTSEKKVANLLISTAFSESGYVTGPWDIYKRYGHGQEIYKHQTIDTYGPWSVRGGLMMANFIISVLQKIRSLKLLHSLNIQIRRIILVMPIQLLFLLPQMKLFYAVQRPMY